MTFIKSNFQSFDYIIVGQGLAGSVLAMTLIQEGFKVAVLNDESLPSASGVAAGLYNPVYGKELNITWKANEIFDYLEIFYSNVKNTIENEVGVLPEFLHQSKIYRAFINQKQQNKFHGDFDYFKKAGFVKENNDIEKYNELIMNDLGGFLVEKSGWLDTKLFVKNVRDYLIFKSCYFLEKVNINVLSELLIEGDIRKVIFCEGFYGSENPLFSWLPWNPAKGEILTIRILDGKSWGEEIINAGIFIVPLGNQTYKVGATYAWHEFSFESTQKAKIDLTQKLDKLLKVPYEIINQEAGVRPATKLRRPFIGLHPEFPQFGIFNGLGSKGVSLAPFFANEFVQFLQKNQEINPEANIQQYYPLYFK